MNIAISVASAVIIAGQFAYIVWLHRRVSREDAFARRALQPGAGLIPEMRRRRERLWLQLLVYAAAIGIVIWLKS